MVETRLTQKYGPQAQSILDLTQAPLMAEVLDENLGLIVAEVVWASAHEMALTLEDMMVRRLGLTYLTADNGRSLAPRVACIMASLLKWTPDELQTQERTYKELLAREHSFQ